MPEPRRKPTRLTYREIQRRVTEIGTDADAVRAAVFSRPTTKETAARESLEAQRGSPFTEPEWEDTKANLLAFVGLMVEWSEPDEHEHA